MRWEQVAGVHRLSAIKALAFWFVATPLLARLFDSGMPRTFFAGFELPFNLYVFYAASMAFFMSSIVYTARCPRIIKNYSGWSDYRASEGSYEKLIPLMIEVLRSKTTQQRDAFLRRQSELQYISLRDSANKPVEPFNPEWPKLVLDYRSLLSASQVQPERLNDVFSGTREAAQTVRGAWLILIVVLHLIGWSFLGWVLVENALSVYVSACTRVGSNTPWSVVCQPLQN